MKAWAHQLLPGLFNFGLFKWSWNMIHNFFICQHLRKSVSNLQCLDAYLSFSPFLSMLMAARSSRVYFCGSLVVNSTIVPTRSMKPFSLVFFFKHRDCAMLFGILLCIWSREEEVCGGGRTRAPFPLPVDHCHCWMELWLVPDDWASTTKLFTHW